MDCRKCGNVLPDYAQYCNICCEKLSGHGMPAPGTDNSAIGNNLAGNNPIGIACPHCKNMLPPGMAACFRCGKLLSEKKNKKKSPVGIIVAVLIILLLGGVYGGHHLGYYSLPLLPESANRSTSDTIGGQAPGVSPTEPTGEPPASNEGSNDGFHEGQEPDEPAPEEPEPEEPEPEEPEPEEPEPEEPEPEEPEPEEPEPEEPEPKEPEPEEPEPEEQPPISFPAPVFTSASASATLAPIGSVRYDPQLVLDGRLDTAWAVRGTGHWIELNAREEQHVSGIRILNGYTKFNDNLGIWLYHANNRPRDIRIQFSDGTMINVTLDDVFDPINPIFHDIELSTVIATTSIRIFVDTVYSGDRWDDTCITMIEVY